MSTPFIQEEISACERAILHAKESLKYAESRIQKKALENDIKFFEKRIVALKQQLKIYLHDSIKVSLDKIDYVQDNFGIPYVSVWFVDNIFPVNVSRKAMHKDLRNAIDQHTVEIKGSNYE